MKSWRIASAAVLFRGRYSTGYRIVFGKASVSGTTSGDRPVTDDGWKSSGVYHAFENLIHLYGSRANTPAVSVAAPRGMTLSRLIMPWLGR